MSVTLMGICWRVEFPTPAMKLVALRFSDVAHDDGDSIWLSVQRVSRETALGESTVRKAIADLEFCKLLRVVLEGSGNRKGYSSTHRSIDIDLLRRVENGAPDKRGNIRPSELVFHETVRPSEKDPQKSIKTYVLIPRDGGNEPLSTDVATAAAPPIAGGVEKSHPSNSERGPLPPVAHTPPTAGPNTSIKHSLPPKPPGKRGGKRAAALNELIDGLRNGEATTKHAVDLFVEPILRQRSFSGPDKDYALRTITKYAAKQTDDVLKTALQSLLTKFPRTVRQSNIEHAIRVACADAKMAANKPSAPKPTDPNIGDHWPRIRTELDKKLGIAVAGAWFDTAVLDRLEGDAIVLAVPNKFNARWITSNFEDQLLAACRAEFPKIEKTVVTAYGGAR